ncbi:hypothetical protein HK096_005563, partial [Nowakowskiella sp. JEL0078]
NKSIGVSNFGVQHLEEMKKYAKLPVAVNQIEITPYLQRREIAEYCKSNNIVIQAYSPLTQGAKLKDPRLIKIAESLCKSTAQVLIKWGLQKGYVSLPKSVHESRMKENIDMLGWEIPANAMEELDSFDEGFRAG